MWPPKHTVLAELPHEVIDDRTGIHQLVDAAAIDKDSPHRPGFLSSRSVAASLLPLPHHKINSQ
jgi:hypothetical protein